MKHHRKWYVLALLAIVALSATLASRRVSSVARFDACLANLENISTAFEMYSTDHEGSFPASIGELIPKYLKEVPVCPSAGYDTYSEGLELGRDSSHNPHGYQDYYYLCCYGHHHPDALVNAPRRDGVTSVLWRDEDQMRRGHGYLGR